jgi:ABC-type Fe3+/spermidine/putrescine transport system ATPase subunit
MNGQAIRVRGLGKRFGGQVVLEGIDFDLGPAEMLVVLGPTGSGKTTLLRILAGLEVPDAGAVILWGRPADGLPPQKRDFGVVFQSPLLFRHLSVQDNVAFGLEVRRAPAGRIRERVERMLDLVGLEPLRSARPARLSAGERQRVALARALAPRPRALLLDEPFAALDSATRSRLRRDLRRILAADRVPAIIVTHDQEEALELADRILVLNGGRVEQIGTPYDLYNHPTNTFVATFLGAANVLLGTWTGTAVAIGGALLSPPTVVPDLHEGQPVKVLFRPEDVVVAFAEHLLRTRHPLGPAVVDSVSYVGPIERLFVRIHLRDVSSLASLPSIAGFPITMTRTKWDADEMGLAAGDPVVVGIKDYRLLPHYPLAGEFGAKIIS